MRALELDRQPHVLRLGREVREAEPQRVGPELLDHVERIDAVALRLRHRLAVAVENLGRDVDARGTAPRRRLYSPASTIRATHSVMMSREVTSTLVG